MSQEHHDPQDYMEGEFRVLEESIGEVNLTPELISLASLGPAHYKSIAEELRAKTKVLQELQKAVGQIINEEARYSDAEQVVPPQEPIKFLAGETEELNDDQIEKINFESPYLYSQLLKMGLFFGHVATSIFGYDSWIEPTLKNLPSYEYNTHLIHTVFSLVPTGILVASIYYSKFNRFRSIERQLGRRLTATERNKIIR